MTLDELRNYVRDRLSIAASDSTKQTQIDVVLNTEYRRMCAEERLNIERTTLSLIADSQVVDLPNDWVETLSLARGNYVLEPVTFQQFAAYDSGVEVPGVDAPIVYYQESPSRIRIYPEPTTTDVDGMTLWYVARPDAMASGTDTPSIIPTEYHDMLAEYAVSRIAMNEEMLDLAQSAKSTADDLRMRMQGQMRRRQGLGSERVNLKVYG